MSDSYPSSSPFPYGAAPFDNRGADESRQRAIRILTDAFAYDVITEFEFERRLGSLGVAGGIASINAVVADLPAARPANGVIPGYRPSPPPNARILGLMSATQRKGPWRVPQELSLTAIMCEMKIDLRYAAVPPGCCIDVHALMANVAIIVPPGMLVDFNINPFLGAARNDADGDFYDASTAQVRVTGSAVMAEVCVRVRAFGR